MNFQIHKKQTDEIKISVAENGNEIGRAYLYIIKNDLHNRPYGLLEDVFIEESARGKGLGTKLIKEVIKQAKELNCYKLIATSRHSRDRVHEMYKKLGFEDYGIEFRKDL